MDLCGTCGRDAHQRCSACKDIWYCSLRCQRQDFRSHKYLCKAFKDFPIPPIPQEIYEVYGRAILFHPKEDRPRFIWLKFDRQFRDGGWLKPRLESVLSIDDNEVQAGGYLGAPRKLEFPMIWPTDRDLPHTIYLQFRDVSGDDESNPNKVVRKVSNLTDKHHDWHGPVIAYGYERFYGYAESIIHLTPEHLPQIADFFRQYLYCAETTQIINPSNSSFLVAPPRYDKHNPRNARIDIVRLNCEGDVQIGKRPKYEGFSIPATHNLFKQEATSLTSHIGIPLITHRVPGSLLAWQNNHLASSADTTFLNIQIAPGANFGHLHPEWKDNIGRVLVARKDRKALHPEHILALVDFITNHILDFRAAHDGALTQDAVREGLGADGFGVYWEGWKVRYGSNVVSPFDV